MEQVAAAEKEASEVLHSLLSVERVEKQTHEIDQNQQVVVVTTKAPDNSVQTGNNGSSLDPDQDPANVVQWHTPVTTVHQALFTDIHEVSPQFTPLTVGEPVIWQGHTIQVDNQPISIVTQTNCSQTVIQKEYVPPTQTVPVPSQQPSVQQQPPPNPQNNVTSTSEGKKKNTKTSRQPDKSKEMPKKKSKLSVTPSGGMTPTRLEENAQEVRERFEKGCECQEENCFKGLSPEYVYRHRLNIAELTKAEHDMYLMGVTMAVLTNPEETVRHKERRRLRAQYVFQGRRVCLDAFLYLENCTHYQLKRIRKHVMTHGVAPRIHGNHGKKPHNTFSLDIYRHATSFLRHFILRNTPGNNTNQNVPSQQTNSSNVKSKSKSAIKTPPLYLPADITRKTIHNAYREYCEHFEPSIKVMGYSTFRHFMKEQFPHVKFCKIECGINKPSLTSGNMQQQNHHHQQQQQQSPQRISTNNQQSVEVEIVTQQASKIQNGESVNVIDETGARTQPDSQSATIITTTGEVQQVTAIPVVVEQETNGLAHQQQTAFIVTPVSQIIHDPTNVSTIPNNTFTSYHLTTAPAANYSTHQQLAQASVVTVASVPNTATNAYGFTTL
ncbi:hypothetical protein L9F63_016042 [Diploptera punctata]|uniref:Uncharacterized protein n=1 Tax=Diploptera punctata TaxID=6984 RepID=A0AAD8A1R9_DIPPU|nr:hypothetical protein L9F63_016042 [Diploptera punctata]